MLGVIQPIIINIFMIDYLYVEIDSIMYVVVRWKIFLF
jgi:hypothetical protein